MAETPNVMPQLHMPLQSGSDRLLKAMRRSYRSERYLGIIDRVRAAMPDAAITTDIIVGFPGETDDDYAATLDVVRRARFASAFTFQYSPRPGTPAATYADQVPPEVVQGALRRRSPALVEEIAWDENKTLVGRSVELLVAEGEGRKDGATLRLSGRAPDNRLVHFVPGAELPRPGDVVHGRDHLRRAAPPGERPARPPGCAAPAPATPGRSARPTDSCATPSVDRPPRHPSCSASPPCAPDLGALRGDRRHRHV